MVRITFHVAVDGLPPVAFEASLGDNGEPSLPFLHEDAGGETHVVVDEPSFIRSFVRAQVARGIPPDRVIQLLLHDNPSKGVPPQIQDKLPITVMGDGSVADGTTSTTCCICLEEYASGETLIVLPCGHRFHRGGKDCNGIRGWMLHHTTCPLCRTGITTPSNHINVHFDVHVEQ
jgi:hypothetical protein